MGKFKLSSQALSMIGGLIIPLVSFGLEILSNFICEKQRSEDNKEIAAEIASYLEGKKNDN